MIFWFALHFILWLPIEYDFKAFCSVRFIHSFVCFRLFTCVFFPPSTFHHLCGAIYIFWLALPLSLIVSGVCEHISNQYYLYLLVQDEANVFMVLMCLLHSNSIDAKAVLFFGKLPRLISRCF